MKVGGEGGGDKRLEHNFDEFATTLMDTAVTQQLHFYVSCFMYVSTNHSPMQQEYIETIIC